MELENLNNRSMPDIMFLYFLWKIGSPLQLIWAAMWRWYSIPFSDTDGCSRAWRLDGWLETWSHIIALPSNRMQSKLLLPLGDVLATMTGQLTGPSALLMFSASYRQPGVVCEISCCWCSCSLLGFSAWRSPCITTATGCSAFAYEENSQTRSDFVFRVLIANHSWLQQHPWQFSMQHLILKSL